MASENRRLKSSLGPEFAAWVEEMGGFIAAEPRALSALLRLWEARFPSRQCAPDPDPWQRSVPLAALRADHQLTDAEIHSFADRQFVEFKLETTRVAMRPVKGTDRSRGSQHRRDAPPRTFRKAAALTLAPRTCFRLTDAGANMLWELLAYFTIGHAASTERAVGGDVNSATEQKFNWDPREGEWSLNRELIRRVAASAKRLRALLEAGNSVDWVNPIPSPFASEHSNSKERVKHLCRELNVLNKHQTKRRVHLSSCDKGRAFKWKILS